MEIIIRNLLKLGVICVILTSVVSTSLINMNIDSYNKEVTTQKAQYNTAIKEEYRNKAELDYNSKTISTNLVEVLNLENVDKSYSILIDKELYNKGLSIVSYEDNDVINAYAECTEAIESINLNLDNLSLLNVDNIESELSIIHNTSLVLADNDTDDTITLFSVSVNQSDALLKIDEPDPDYTGCIVKLDKEDREILERLVMGEAGDEGFIGAALVAQAIRDTLVYRNYDSVEEVRVGKKYAGKLIWKPNKDVREAVKFIFDEGGIAVKHKIIYFYAPHLVKSDFHESLEFVVEHGGHRFFYGR